MKKTLVKKVDRKNIDSEVLKASTDILKSGGLVSFPTETVYGLGANALDEEAVKSIFKAKGRPSDNPLIVHIYNSEQVRDLATEISETARILIDKFWPGPLTLLFKKSQIVSNLVSADLDTVAIRMPDDEIALAILKDSNLPIAAPSANTSGRPSPTNASHVLEDLEGKVDLVIDGGKTGVGVESTVLDLTPDIPTILRPGGVTIEELESVIGEVVYDKAIESEDVTLVPKSPGQKYRHYSPKAKMKIFSGDTELVVKEINKKANDYIKAGLNIGIIATDETISKYDFKNVISMGSRKNLKTIGANLFNVLREFDKLDVDLILSEGVKECGFGKAIMNRMKKAAGGNETHLK